MKKSSVPGMPVDISALLNRLHWTVLRPLASRLGGEERSLFHGAGMEFDELREYQPGDDVRLIDWNVTARHEKAFVRQAYTPRALDVWLVVDVSASVDWGTARCLKRELALEFTAVIGQILEHGRHHTGALLFADQPLRFIAPGGGRDHLFHLLDAIQTTGEQDQGTETNLTAALLKLDLLLKRRSTVLLISDFLIKDGWLPAVSRMARRHEVVAIRLVDPREMELPDVGLITLEDPETGRQKTVNTHDAHLRERFREAAREQAAQIRTDLIARGVDYLELNTEDDLLPGMIRFLENRRRQAPLIQRGQPAQQAALAANRRLS